MPREEGGQTPALALTAYARTEDRVRALSAGFQMHLGSRPSPASLCGCGGGARCAGRY